MSESKPIIGILIISTRKYDIFVRPLLDSINKYFIVDYNIVVHIFEDKPIQYKGYDRVKIKHHIIPSYAFPFATLFRYKTFFSFEKEITQDVLFYLDVDMLVNDYVTDSMLPPGNGLITTIHPGATKESKWWGSPNTHEKSSFWIPVEKRILYHCGGFQGGTRNSYLAMAKRLSELIDKDLETAKEIGYTANHGILAEWHDESAFNWYLTSGENKDQYRVTLSSSYCYPESWNLPNCSKIILALDKNHNEIRS